MSDSSFVFAGMKLTKRQIGIGVGIAALILALVAASPQVRGWVDFGVSSSVSRDPDGVDSVNPLPVKVGTISFVDSIEQTRHYTGTIRAQHQSDLGFERSGRLETVLFDEGDTVQEGEVLASLNLETLQAQRKAIVARIAQAESVMDELNAGPRVEAINAAQANVDGAKSVHDNAVLNLERRLKLLNADAISSEEYDRASFAVISAMAVLKSAREKLSELESGTRSERIAAHQAALQHLLATCQEIDVALSQSELIAPFSGTITRRYLDPGNIAQPAAPIVRLVQRQNLEAWIGLPVSVAARVELDEQYEILIERVRYSVTASAKIHELNVATRTQTVLFKLQPSLVSAAIPGQLCEIQFSSSVSATGCWVPTTALSRGIRGLWSLMVVSADPSAENYITEKRDVEILKMESDRVLVRGTIESGESFVVDGLHRITVNQRVAPVPTQSTAQQTGSGIEQR